MVTVNRAAPTHREDIFVLVRMDSSCSTLPTAEVYYCMNVLDLKFEVAFLLMHVLRFYLTRYGTSEICTHMNPHDIL